MSGAARSENEAQTFFSTANRATMTGPKSTLSAGNDGKFLSCERDNSLSLINRSKLIHSGLPAKVEGDWYGLSP